jgi:hypothetical protein
MLDEAKTTKWVKYNRVNLSRIWCVKELHTAEKIARAKTYVIVGNRLIN